MSMKLMAWLGDIEDEIGHSEFRVLFRLCWHTNEQNLVCCPSVDELVRGAGMSKSSVLRALKELEARSFIVVERDRWDSGRQKNNRYTILADVVITLPGGRKVDLSPTPEQRENRVSPAEPGENSRVSNEPGVTHDANRVSIVTPEEQGSRNKEQIPPLATQGHPLAENEDLFGGATEIAELFDVVQFVENEWSNLKRDHPGIGGIRKIDDGLAHQIRLRTSQHKLKDESEAELWERVFAEIRNSRFLQGRVPPSGGRENPFKLTLPWLVKAAMFREVINGKYSRSADDGRLTDRTGRPLRQADQDAADTITRILARDRGRRGAGAAG